MAPIICGNCKRVYESAEGNLCPNCKTPSKENYEFQNSDDFLLENVKKIEEERKEFNLDGLTTGLNSIIINTEPEKHQDAIKELLKFSGFEFQYSYERDNILTSLLSYPKSADIMIQSRKEGENPFRIFNKGPKISSLPNTRIETFVFHSKDLEKYVTTQKQRGIQFMTQNIVDFDNYKFIQSLPTTTTGLSYGFIEWKTGERDYIADSDAIFKWDFPKPDLDYLKNIKYLDHTATRVRAKDRDSAIIEFMKYTNYKFDFAVYVKGLNSITNVARLADGEFAMVFTSGISEFKDLETSGPTEKFIYNYGTRVHHMAFHTEKIDETFVELRNNGMKFLVDLVGSREEGLKQTFTVQSPNTLMVNEYIHRFDDFDGFFTKSNVTDLTRATDKQ